jgi:hypothetical protein
MSKDKFSWFEKQSEANATKPAWNIPPQDGRRKPTSTNLAAGAEDSQAVDQSAAGEQSVNLEYPAGQNQQPEPKFKIKTDTKRSASPKQIAANRLNAKKSTGPKTDKGKTFSSQNSMKHGFLSKVVVIKDADGQETQDEFDDLHADLRNYYRPQTYLEQQYVERIAVGFWRKRRSLRFEVGVVNAQYRNRRISEKGNLSDVLKMFHTDAETKQRQIEGPPILDALCLPVKPEAILKYECAIEKQLSRDVAFLEQLQALTRNPSQTSNSTNSKEGSDPMPRFGTESDGRSSEEQDAGPVSKDNLLKRTQ